MRPLRKAVFDIIHHFPPFINITFHFFQKGALQPLNLCYNVRVPIRKGPVAQLGARSVRIREVVGSNPIRSTRWTLHEHLFFQRRLCREGVAVMSNVKEAIADAIASFSTPQNTKNKLYVFALDF